MPASCGEILPSAVTAVASVNTRPAPPRANAPRCTRCQSVGWPSTDEYWHIGDTQIRLRNVVPRKVSGANSRLTRPFNASAFERLPAATSDVARDTPRPARARRARAWARARRARARNPSNDRHCGHEPPVRDGVGRRDLVVAADRAPAAIPDLERTLGYVDRHRRRLPGTGIGDREPSEPAPWSVLVRLERCDVTLDDLTTHA